VTATTAPTSLTRQTRTSTADSTATGVLSGTPLEAIFTTASWARAVSDNQFTRASFTPTTGTISATSRASVHNSITFSVGQLSNYTWSASFLSMVGGTATNSPDSYFLLQDSGLTPIAGFGCESCADGSLSGSGQLLAGSYTLTWGGDARSTSSEGNATLGTLFGSAEFTQFGVLNVTAVPEPSAVAMMLAALALLGGVAKRRQRKSA
jgi:hypothetical protein